MRTDPATVIWIVTGILIVLKALGMIPLSWWWVTIAIWLPFAVSIGILTIVIGILLIAFIGVIIFIGIVEIIDKISEYKRRKNK